MGQIKNIKLHIVTDIKANLLIAAATGKHFVLRLKDDTLGTW